MRAEVEKEPEMQIGQPTDVKHVAHIGWEGPSATTPSWVCNLFIYLYIYNVLVDELIYIYIFYGNVQMHDYKSPEDEAKGSSNKKPASSGERKKNKGRRKSSTSTNSPAESPARPRRSTGKQREQSTGSGSESGSGLDLPQQNDQSVVQKTPRQKKSKGTTAVRGGGGEPPLPVAPVES